MVRVGLGEDVAMQSASCQRVLRACAFQRPDEPSLVAFALLIVIRADMVERGCTAGGALPSSSARNERAGITCRGIARRAAVVICSMFRGGPGADGSGECPRTRVSRAGAVPTGGIMQLLIAHHDEASRLALKLVAAALPGGDFEVIESGEGMETLDVLLAAGTPLVAVVDWDLPKCEGPELCRLVRAYRHAGPPYIILLARDGHRLAEGLESGADDCVHTPANADELRARINVGRRFAGLQWERLVRAPASDRQEVAEHVLHAVPELDAMLATADDEPTADDVLPEPRFELQSVLVAH